MIELITYWWFYRGRKLRGLGIYTTDEADAARQNTFCKGGTHRQASSEENEQISFLINVHPKRRTEIK